MSLRPWLLAAALLVVVPALVPAGASGNLAFTAPVKVGADVGEPGLRVSPTGQIFVHYPGGMATSLDGGATWRPAFMTGARIFGGDADMVLLADGTPLYADLSGLSISVARSVAKDGMGVWAQNLVASDYPLVDRQWLEVGRDPVTGDEIVYLAFNARVGGLQIVTSRSGGVVFEGARSLSPDKGWTCFRGNLAVSPVDGAAYVADCTGSGPRIWRTADGALSWQARAVDDRPFGYSGFLFPNVATDAAGNVYVAWAERLASQTRVFVRGSQDGGLSWTPRVELTTPTSAGVMPWIVGGSAGRIGVAWYSASAQGHADAMPASAEWRVSYAVFADFFGGAAPATATVSDDIIQRGSICGSGTGCDGARNLLDFFEVQRDAAGVAHFAYADGCLECDAVESSRSSRVMFARQVAGPLLIG